MTSFDRRQNRQHRRRSTASFRRIALGAITATTALSFGIGSAQALPTLPTLPGSPALPQMPASPALPQLPQLPAQPVSPDAKSIIDSAYSHAQGTTAPTIALIRQGATGAINALPLSAEQKASAIELLTQTLDTIEPAPSTPPQQPAPEPVTEPVTEPQPEAQPRPEPSNPCPATATACVDLANQQTWLQENGEITYGPVPITSGMPGYETTTGNLTVLRKVKDEWSQPYNGPMPYAVYFTNDGEAFHEGSLNEASHGCIHLSHDAAVMYFDTLDIGDGVYIW
ncbi:MULTISPECIES: L,D-transpeptidase [unclassified Corynebacterium]|uniref:L,D-transpeptidase n=1 Tax=unclassified Corynebacterium TaxID=2624378 RepID=UPI003097F528